MALTTSFLDEILVFLPSDAVRFNDLEDSLIAMTFLAA